MRTVIDNLLLRLKGTLKVDDHQEEQSSEDILFIHINKGLPSNKSKQPFAMMSLAGMPIQPHAEYRRMKPEDAALHITVSFLLQGICIKILYIFCVLCGRCCDGTRPIFNYAKTCDVVRLGWSLYFSRSSRTHTTACSSGF